MSRPSIATPCPVPYQSNAFAVDNENENDTTFNFTSALRPTLRNTKPKRNRGSVQFAIHEDGKVQDERSEYQRSTLLQPAKRTATVQVIPQTVQVQSQAISVPRNEFTSTIHPLRTSRLSQAPKRPAVRLSVVPENASKDSDKPRQDVASPKPSRHGRRGTLYIPNEDTTMPSMYMGIFSPIKNYDPEAEGQPTQPAAMEMTGIAAQMAVKRASRKSIMSAAPRRVALQSTARKVQESANIVDRPGQGGGKENVPPGFEECEKVMFDLNLSCDLMAGMQPGISPKQVSKDVQHAGSNIFAPTAASLRRVNTRVSPRESPEPASSTNNGSKPVWNGGSRSQSTFESHQRPKRLLKTAPIIPAQVIPKPRIPTRFVIPRVQPDTILNQHALLPENIANPNMYEDDWLGHQEIAITQLVNDLFGSSELNRRTHDTSQDLRRQLVKVYNTDPMALMYKRLHAALLYGSLGIPQDVLDQGDSLHKDIGRKQRFVDLWLNTYDPTALEAALEVVIGRQCRPLQSCASTGSSPTRTISRKMLKTYIEAFLLRNEDGRPDRDARSRAAWSYQRTVLRSLMLVKVLDLVKTDHTVKMPTCLFLSSSSIKSSVLVLQTLIQMVNTAAGDPVRALSLIDYHLDHVQNALEEHDYTIENLAVDLRDGTRLTRIVELLLYPAASGSLEKSYDPEATTTILMPEGETLDFNDGQDWPLSQHLIFPCQGRATRLWNVQIALSAVQNVKGMTGLIGGITAQDIVDGYREKTMRLLWALVGKWGLTGLIDWRDVEWETRRLQLHTSSSCEDCYDDFDELDPGGYPFEKCRKLLKSWARAVTKSQGVPLRNFTTSFADGKIFEAIVNVYEPLLHCTATRPKTSLQDRLTNLGCSQEFAQLFSSAGAVHVFDRDFVLAALAFLCSRLLTPSKAARAAVVIQQAWRGHWNKVEATRKEQKKEVALACAEIAKTKTRVVDDGGEESNTVETCCRREGSGSNLVDGEEGEDYKGHDPIASPMSVSGGDIWLSL